MKRIIRISIVSASVAAVGLTAASGASAATLRGTVVHKNARAHSFTVANSRGRLSAVHARRSPRVGQVVRVRARRLRNGTFKALRIRRGGLRRHVKVRGTVTYRNRSKRLYVVSARGVSMVVHLRRSKARSAADTLPPVGDDVTVDANIDEQGELEQNDVDDHGADSGRVELEGVVLAVDANARKLTLSSDDEDKSGGTVTVILPAGFDPSAFHVGDEVELIVTLNPDGTYTAVSSAKDGDDREADDGSHHQADVREHGGGGERRHAGERD